MYFYLLEYYYRVSSHNNVGSAVSNWQRANTIQGGNFI